MASKQANQQLPSRNSTRPYVIGNKHRHLTSSLFKHEATSPGAVIYKNDEILIVIFNPTDGQDSYVEQFSIVKFSKTADKFAIELHYARDIGDFDTGDLLFEYDSYREGVYAGGYNLVSAYVNFFGMTFEDSIVLSESAAKKMVTQKIDSIIIPIYSHTLMSANTYPDSKYGFIPEIGQTINGKIIYSYFISKDNTNKENLLATLSLESLVELLNDDYQFSLKHKFTKLKDAKITNIKIHKFKNSKTVLDDGLKVKLQRLFTDYGRKCQSVFKDLVKTVGQEYALSVISSHYLMTSHKQNLCINTNDLLYVIELEMVKEYPVNIGDKCANAYANKGVVSCIIPDELMPTLASTGERVDCVLGALSVYSRMIFAQIIVIVLSKVIKFIEREILNDPSTISHYIRKLIKLNNVIGNVEYSKQLTELAVSVDNDPYLMHAFIESVENGGLYFEMANFTDFDFEELLNMIEDEFGIKSNETIIYPQKLYPYMADLTGNKEALLPNKDVHQNDIFCGPNYVVRLKYIAQMKNTARDLGAYSATTKQPIKDITGNSNTNAVKIGNMECDALIAHGLVEYVIPELRTVKSDCTDMKSEMVFQHIKNGEYSSALSETTGGASFTKSVIDALMVFLSYDYK